MRLRSIFAPSAREAILRAREAFGDDARILTTRGTPNGVELIIVEEGAARREAEVSNLRGEVRALRGRLAETKYTVPAGLEELSDRLDACGIAGGLRESAMRAALPHRGILAFDAAANALARSIQILPAKPRHPGGPRVLAIVGPTGVGKTTTIAKLAGRLVHDSRRRVALVTLDTYRVGAVEQLRAYADLLNSQFEVAFTPADAVRAVDKFKDCDVVLLDTTGRSPLDEPRVAELAATVRHVDRLEVLLTIPAAISHDAARVAIEQFSPMNPTGMIITKLDETRHVGPAFCAAHERNLPLAFLCNGQEVPGDLERASGERAAKWILSAGAAAAHAAAAAI
ncbi:MAG: hypothetical protein HY286_19330 [Planctomycetes bacterium]|nr:hypothetical protein [Planctomycetota bacterium]